MPGADSFFMKRCPKCGRTKAVQMDVRKRLWMCMVCNIQLKESGGALYRYTPSKPHQEARI